MKIFYLQAFVLNNVIAASLFYHVVIYLLKNFHVIGVRFLANRQEKPMTPLQREQIVALRNKNLGYGTIAKKLGISRDRVKSFCRIHNLMGLRAIDVPKEKIIQEFCMNCGAKLIHPPGKRSRKFCSDECRTSWWNAHPDKVP